MAIVKMTKFHLMFFAKDRPHLMRALQEFDDVQLDEVKDMEDLVKAGVTNLDTNKTITAASENMSRLEEAIQILDAYKEEKLTFKQKFSNALPDFDFKQGEELVKENHPEEVVKEILSLKEAKTRSEDQIGRLREQMDALSYWKNLDVPLEQVDKVESVKVRMGSIAVRWLEEIRRFVATEAQDTYLEVLYSNEKIANLLLITHGDNQKLENFLHDIGFAPVAFKGEGTIQDQIAEKEKEIQQEKNNIAKDIEQLKDLEKNKRSLLETAYELEAYRKRLSESEKNMAQTDKMSLVDGYVPTERLGEFEQILKTQLEEGTYVFESQAADVEDPEVPIQLKNSSFFSPFESIVETFSLPQYKEMDPTPLMAPWYILFFGIMIGDFGYGVILFIAATLALHGLKLKPATRNSMKFFQILSIPTMIAGLCFGSIFGGLIPMKPLIIDPTKFYMPMIAFSVVVGIVNIFAGLALTAVKNFRLNDPKGAVYDSFSWIMLLAGLLVGGLASFMNWGPMVKNIGFGLAIVGAVMIVLFSAREEKGVGRFAWGLYNLYGVTGYIGDFASYTRITALALSSAFIGLSFNMIAGMLANRGIIGMVFAALLLVVLHLFNLFLSGLSAYVHSMRLIYVEFFGKFYEGGGKPFKRLRPEAKYINFN